MIRLEEMSYKKEELDLIAEWRNESLVNLRTNTPTDPENQKKWVEGFTYIERYFFIYDDEHFVGYCGLDKINNTNRTAEMGLLIGPSHKRQKIGYVATKILLQFGFIDLGLNCIFIEVYQTTMAWIFWQKCGFKKEGLLRDRKFWDGLYYDSIVASITTDEFGQ